ncbi:MAG: SAM-dependent methyltransferase [Myxococcaceae bacterium]|nr:SAM-dependent methyltransferase [Myxococcaceae bacterium]
MRDALALVVLSLLALGALSIVISTLRLGISPMPTSRAVRAVMLDFVPPSLGGEVHELGAAWGGVALALARRCPAARVVAWERSAVPFAVAWLRARASGLANLEVRRADFLEADFSRATALVCYLWTGGMRALDEKLRRELPGRPLLIVTNTFLLHGWPESASATAPDLYRTKVARYDRVP